MRNLLYFLSFSLLFIYACSNDNQQSSPEQVSQELTIFFVNDQHGQIDNFSKIKHIIDAEREKTNVIVACGGDMFSGNPVVDNAIEEGAPMIDLMNKTGFDVSVVGNHEFDYGQQMLKNRMAEANFDWVCANVDMQLTGVPQPEPFASVEAGGLKIGFVGLIETYGKDGEIPSTHPNKVEGISFTYYDEVVGQYSHLKAEEDYDLLVALTHLGLSTDKQLAQNYNFFDLIIGGHSHSRANELINNTRIVQAGGYLNYLGKVSLLIRDKQIESFSYDLIELADYKQHDQVLQTLIDTYNDLPYLKEVIGYSHNYHDRSQVGCFYTDALKDYYNVDISFQNTGGVRADLDKGDISRRDIFEISPFKNGIIIYEMSALDVKKFLIGSRSGFYYAGVNISQSNQSISIKDANGNEYDDDQILTVAINDFIPAVHYTYFSDDGQRQPLTAAHTLMAYLEQGNGQINYQNCNRYFRYQ